MIINICNMSYFNKLQKARNACIRYICSLRIDYHETRHYRYFHCLNINERRIWWSRLFGLSLKRKYNEGRVPPGWRPTQPEGVQTWSPLWKSQLTHPASLPLHSQSWLLCLRGFNNKLSVTALTSRSCSAWCSRSSLFLVVLSNPTNIRCYHWIIQISLVLNIETNHKYSFKTELW